MFSKTLGLDSSFVAYSSTLVDDKELNGIEMSYPMWHGREAVETTLEEVEIETDSIDPDARAHNYLYYIGDTVILKLNTLDKDHYQFWQNFFSQRGSANNPFTSPSGLITNIEGGALGIWGGYGVAYDTIIICHDGQNNHEVPKSQV